jgi:hypothetical protein
MTFQKIGEGLFHDQIFFDVAGMYFLDNGFIHHPAEPEFIEEDNFLVVHHQVVPPGASISIASTNAKLRVLRMRWGLAKFFDPSLPAAKVSPAGKGSFRLFP